MKELLGEGAFGEVWLATVEDIHKLRPRKSKRPVNKIGILKYFTRKWRSSTKKTSLVAVKKLKGRFLVSDSKCFN